MSRIESGQLRLDMQPVVPAGVIAKAIDAVLPAATAKGIDLRTVLDPRAGIVSADPDRLQQIVWNLLTNAVKFTPPGRQGHRRRRGAPQRGRGAASATTARASRPSSWPACSIASSSRTRRRRGATAASASACRSPANWRSCMAAACKRRALAPAKAPTFRLTLPLMARGRGPTQRSAASQPGQNVRASRATSDGSKASVCSSSTTKMMAREIGALRAPPCRRQRLRGGERERGVRPAAQGAAGGDRLRHRHARCRTATTSSAGCAPCAEKTAARRRRRLSPPSPASRTSERAIEAGYHMHLEQAARPRRADRGRRLAGADRPLSGGDRLRAGPSVRAMRPKRSRGADRRRGRRPAAPWSSRTGACVHGDRREAMAAREARAGRPSSARSAGSASEAQLVAIVGERFDGEAEHAARPSPARGQRRSASARRHR